MEPWIEVVGNLIASDTGEPFEPARRSGAGGGSISQGFVLAGIDGRRFFVKRNQLRLRPMFEAEAAGLKELARCAELRIPRALGVVAQGSACFLVLEHLELGGPAHGAGLGRGIAALHRITAPEFGWSMDNFIGSTPQPNGPCSDWVEFYRDERLAHQRRLARQNGARRALLDAVARLEQELGGFFPEYHPPPSLLHGDLWSGNWGFLPDGSPALFDPAVYYGDREADIAMMELFGHPGADFFAAYNERMPLDPGYAVRRELYNLYHILNHFNLFGGGYAAQAERMALGLLAQLR
ncbi:fructosamine kinase [Thioalkalivibrio nitratireducens DSM 14787]|uniref:Fructosamine kinase n=1 Tax=Thioalkalivibrio nitratireducens (strain DSM 14787 / UNIQEM 213 / ALEN2) TaxID=1255043 RepID=L0DSI0_THIND|nr:fructosamine kinase family protein [Thioalkalivibrio nitratireducens]AGA31930.1 fructosamine kinase [Thioalkalivibrio nitratireducens DSM 14787]